MADLKDAIYNAVANYTTNPLYALDPAKILLSASASAGQIASQNYLNSLRAKQSLLDLLATGIKVWGDWERTKTLNAINELQKQRLEQELINQKLKELALYTILSRGGF